MVTYLRMTTMVRIQKISDMAPRTLSLEGSDLKMLGNTYKGDVPAHMCKQDLLCGICQQQCVCAHSSIRV